MTYLPQHKGLHDCSVCPAKNTPCRKVKKDFICLNCYSRGKKLEQVDKAKERDAKRAVSRPSSSFGNIIVPETCLEAENEQELSQWQWFLDRRSEMTGKCLFCGGKTQMKDDKTFHFSIAHILPKKEGFGGFPSVATHSQNFIELCYYGNSCHSNLDLGKITWDFIRDSVEWQVIQPKLMQILPFVALSERKNKLYSKLQSLVVRPAPL